MASDVLWLVLNLAAWCGWTFVLYLVIAFDDGPVWTAPALPEVVLACELYACVEVLRMVVGQLKGNVQMGLVLHFTRLVVYHGVLPAQPEVAKVILIAWTVADGVEAR